MDRSLLEKFFRNELTPSERDKAIRFLSDPENDLLLKIWLKEHWDLIRELNASENENDPAAMNAWQNIRRQITSNEGTASSISLTPSDSDTSKFNPFRIDESIDEGIDDRVGNSVSNPVGNPVGNPVSNPVGSRVSSRVSNRIDEWIGKPIRKRIFNFAAAAILLVIMSAAGFLIYNKEGGGKPSSKNNQPTQAKSIDVAPPAASRAVLTLANGEQIYLDSSGKGTIASQGQTKILKTDDGEIVYKGSESSLISYNTLSLPKGSKPIRLALSDGTIVWLNAASSVTYPTAFNGKDRKVSITGEAYFEVAKSPGQSFFVAHDGLLIKVLGTHFNVNTYADEQDIKVTLLEGSVDVLKDGHTANLRPGQQAALTGKRTNVSDVVDLEEVMAWKNEQFYFSGTHIKAIMRQIEKYYDVDVEYRDEVPYQFVAKISRQVNVSEFLQKLELTNLVHFKIEGKKIIVSK